MDQRANIIEQDVKDILETRLEIGRKMQLLDEKARYEMENVKAKLSDWTADVAGTGKEFIDQSTRALNPLHQMNVRPWAALTGVVLFGYVIGMLEKRFRRAKVYPYYPPKAHGAPVMPSEEEKKGSETESGVYPYFPEGHREPNQESNRGRPYFSSDLWSDVKGTVRTEVQRSKDAIGYALREFARDMSKEIVPIILKSMTSPQSRGSRR